MTESEIERLQASHEAMKDALRDFLENPAFQVGVGGNPIAVERMIAKARAALKEAEGERS